MGKTLSLFSGDNYPLRFGDALPLSGITIPVSGTEITMWYSSSEKDTDILSNGFGISPFIRVSVLIPMYLVSDLIRRRIMMPLR